MRIAAITQIAAVLVMGVPGVRADQAQTSSVITLRVGVVSSNGSAVRGLTREDFSVRIDDEPVEVRSVRTDDPLPLLVLVDVSVSAAGSSDDLRSQIARDVLGALAPGTPLRVVAFGRTLRVPAEWTADRRAQDAQLRRALNVPDDERHGPSPVWDVIDESLRTLLPADGRAGILLVTDGQTTGNRVRLSVPADRAIVMGVPISVVFVGSIGRLSQRGESTAIVRPDRAVAQLAAATGGAFFNRSRQQRNDWDGGPGGDPLRRAAVSLSEAYLLEVVVPSKPGFQRVSVTTRDTSHVVRARMGVVVR